MKTAGATLSGFLAIGFWSISALIVSFTGTIPPMLLSSIATLTGAMICFAYWAIRRENILHKFDMSWKAYALGLFGICGYTSLWLIGLKLAPAFEANALNYMWPLLLMLGTSYVDKTRIQKRHWIGLILGLVGSLFIFTRYIGHDVASASIFGLLCALGGALVWATYSTMTKIIAYESDRVGIFLLATACITFVCHMTFETTLQTVITPVGGIAVLLLGVTRVSFIFWDKAMKEGDRQMLASIAYLIPALSVTLLAIFTPVEWTQRIVIGAIMVVAGCLIANADKLMGLLSRYVR